MINFYKLFDWDLWSHLVPNSALRFLRLFVLALSLTGLSLVAPLAAAAPLEPTSPLPALFLPSQFSTSDPSAQDRNGFDVALQGFHLVSIDQGWIVLDQRLYWTKNGGEHWIDITPEDLNQAMIRAAAFVDTQHGWLFLTHSEPWGRITYSVARTSDGGYTWQTIPLSLFEPGDVSAFASALYPHFLDSRTGWLAVKRATSSNFSLGSLFKTTDGGQTWTRLTIPIGEPVTFVTEEIGWTAGGAAGDEFYRTHDGGLTWYAQALGRSSGLAGQHVSYQLPVFEDALQGLLPVVVSESDKSRIDLYATRDTGRSWKLAAQLPLEPEVAPGTPVPLSLLDNGRWMLVMPHSNHYLTASTGGEKTIVPSQSPLLSGVTQLDMVTSSVGWARYMAGGCARPAPGDDPLSASEPVAGCSMEVRLLRTEDGGLSWTVLSLPPTGFSGDADRSQPDLETSAQAATEPAYETGVLKPLASRTQHFVGQGFDKCEVASLSQLETWITDSPYEAVNLYIGGSNRGCANSALTESYVAQISQQGWTFIPTWVGPQAACSSYPSRISYDQTTAYDQGLSEASAAIDAAANLGLTAPDKSGTIIYYDLEAYDTNNVACRNASKAFISGWTAQLQASGNLAGVYSLGWILSDFASISKVPDAIWAAHWIAPPMYRSDATVWGVAYLDDTLWANHQRLRQYAGDHNETWGSVTLNIDSNVADGIVANISSAAGWTIFFPVILKDAPY